MVARKRTTPVVASPVVEPVVVAAPVAVEAAPPVEAAPAVEAVAAEPVAKPAAKAAKEPKESKEKVAEKVEKVEKEKAEKPARKPKVVRDSFTMPETDYARLAELKKRTLSAGVSAKKSELLRAGLQALSQLSAADLAAVISGLESVKTGRPAGDKAAEA